MSVTELIKQLLDYPGDWEVVFDATSLRLLADNELAGWPSVDEVKLDNVMCDEFVVLGSKEI